MNTAAFGHREKGDSFCLEELDFEQALLCYLKFFYGISRNFNFLKNTSSGEFLYMGYLWRASKFF